MRTPFVSSLFGIWKKLSVSLLLSALNLCFHELRCSACTPAGGLFGPGTCQQFPLLSFGGFCPTFQHSPPSFIQQPQWSAPIPSSPLVVVREQQPSVTVELCCNPNNNNYQQKKQQQQQNCCGVAGGYQQQQQQQYLKAGLSPSSYVSSSSSSSSSQWASVVPAGKSPSGQYSTGLRNPVGTGGESAANKWKPPPGYYSSPALDRYPEAPPVPESAPDVVYPAQRYPKEVKPPESGAESKQQQLLQQHNQIQVEAAKIQNEPPPDQGSENSLVETLLRNKVVHPTTEDESSSNLESQQAFVQEQSPSPPEKEENGAVSEDRELLSQSSAPRARSIWGPFSDTTAQEVQQKQKEEANPGGDDAEQGEEEAKKRQSILRQRCLQEIHSAAAPSISILLRCLELDGVLEKKNTESIPAPIANEVNRNAEQQRQERCTFDGVTSGDDETCSFYSPTPNERLGEQNKFHLAHFYTDDGVNAPLRAVFGQLSGSREFPTGGFLLALDRPLNGTASRNWGRDSPPSPVALPLLRLDIPCQVGDGLLLFDFWSISADGREPTVKVCTRRSTERSCTTPITRSVDSARVEVQVVSPGARVHQDSESFVLEMSPTFPVGRDLTSSNSMIILDNLEYRGEKCSPKKPFGGDLGQGAQPPQEVDVAEKAPNGGEPGGVWKDSGSALQRHAGNSWITRESHFEIDSSGLDIKPLTSETKRHSGNAPPWNRSGSSPPSSSSSTSRSEFFRREMPKLMALPPGSFWSPPRKLFAVREEQSLSPLASGRLEGGGRDFSGGAGKDPSSPFFSNKLSLLFGDGEKAKEAQQKLEENSKQKLTEFGENNEKLSENLNTKKSHFTAGKALELSACEALNCSFQQGSFCHYTQPSAEAVANQFGGVAGNWRLSAVSPGNFVSAVSKNVAATNGTGKGRVQRDAGGFAFVGRLFSEQQSPESERVGQSNCVRCPRDQRAPPAETVRYVLESAPFSLDGFAGDLQFDLLRSPSSHSSTPTANPSPLQQQHQQPPIMLQVCVDSFQNCVQVGCPVCPSPSTSLHQQQQQNLIDDKHSQHWKRESVHLAAHSKKVFFVATQWRPGSWLAIDNIRLVSTAGGGGFPCKEQTLGTKNEETSYTKKKYKTH